MDDHATSKWFHVALALLRKMPNASDNEIYNAFLLEGVDPHLAADFVDFIPLAYGRLLLANSGARFSDSFQRRLPDGQLSESRPLSSEPIWNLISSLAKEELSSGISKDRLLSVAGRSAEIDAANQLLNKGSKLEDIVFSAPVFLAADRLLQ
jgi:hypothetical protein